MMSLESPVGRLAQWVVVLLTVPLLLAACDKQPADEVSGGPAIRLFDLFSNAVIEGGPAKAGAGVQWQFGASSSLQAAENAATMGWAAGGGVAGLEILNGRLRAFTSDERPIVHVALDGLFQEADLVHSVEIKALVTEGTNLGIAFQNSAQADPEALREACATLMTTPIQAGESTETYTIRASRAVNVRDIRHLLLRPSDATDAEFQVESIRIVTLKEHLAEKSAALGWHGLGEIYRETIAAPAPATIRFDVALQSRPWLDLAIGTIEADAVTFRVGLTEADKPAAKETVVFEEAVTDKDGWKSARVDLAAYAGRKVSLTLGLESAKAGALGFWGAPTVRNSVARPADSEDGSARPQGVILVLAETPDGDASLSNLAPTGVLFRNCVAQAADVTAQASSVLTSLYPTTHTVFNATDRLPSSAETLGEIYRKAGYATLSLSSTPGTGQRTILHQGFETLHESESFDSGTRSAQAYIARLLPWLKDHGDVPFFVFMHVAGKGEELGGLLDSIKQAGLAEKTVVALMGHDKERASGPLLLVQPGSLAVGHAVDVAVQAIGVMPTLLELSGLTLSDDAAGRSLLPLAATSNALDLDRWASRPAVTERTVVPCPSPNGEQASTTLILGDWKLVHNAPGPGDRPEYALYKHGDEATDVAAGHPEEVARLRTELDGWRERAVSGQLTAGASGMTGATSDEMSALESLGYL